MVIDVLDTAMGQLVATVGSEKRGLSALLAVIAERLLPSEDVEDDDAGVHLTTNTVQNA